MNKSNYISIVEIAKAANAAGMTYGKYMAKYRQRGSVLQKKRDGRRAAGTDRGGEGLKPLELHLWCVVLLAIAMAAIATCVMTEIQAAEAAALSEDVAMERDHLAELERQIKTLERR